MKISILFRYLKMCYQHHCCVTLLIRGLANVNELFSTIRYSMYLAIQSKCKVL